jgi:hypothetical protein
MKSSSSSFGGQIRVRTRHFHASGDLSKSSGKTQAWLRQKTYSRKWKDKRLRIQALQQRLPTLSSPTPPERVAPSSDPLGI